MNTATIPVVEVTTPDPSRYYAVALAPSLAASNDVPFVVKSIEDAKNLLWAISEGRDSVDVREWVQGAVVESRTSFHGTQSNETELWCYVTPPGETEDPHPEFIVKRGPRGGVKVERLGPPKKRREPRKQPAPPILASERVIP